MRTAAAAWTGYEDTATDGPDAANMFHQPAMMAQWATADRAWIGPASSTHATLAAIPRRMVTGRGAVWWYGRACQALR